LYYLKSNNSIVSLEKSQLDQDYEKKASNEINIEINNEEKENLNCKIKEIYRSNSTEIVDYLNHYQPIFFSI
jgi:hypothetical protein